MSDVSTLLSFLGGSSTTGNSSQGLQRTVGTAATVGLSLTLLRFLVAAVDGNSRTVDRIWGDNTNNNNSESSRSRSEVLYQFMKSLVRRMLLLQGNMRQIGNGSVENTGSNNNDDGDNDSEDDVPILHSGACHCRSVQFEVRACLRFFSTQRLLDKRAWFLLIPVPRASTHHLSLSDIIPYSSLRPAK